MTARNDDAGDTVRFTVSLPRPMLDALDSRMVGQGYASRSEFVRDLIRDQLIRDRWREGRAEVVGVLTIGYDHHQRELAERLVAIQHRAHVHILCTTHVHLDADTCLEAIIIRGRPRAVERMSIELGGLRGVQFARLARVSRPVRRG